MKQKFFAGVCFVGLLPFFNVAAVTRYVNVNNTGPASPYTSWPTASTNIQLAVDAASSGDLILVAAGDYRVGGISQVLYKTRLMVGKSVIIQSVNGPSVTTIRGNPVSGDSGIRCVYMTASATLGGFTLADGATPTRAGSLNQGGGVWCTVSSAVVSNCIIRANRAVNGGGAAGGTLINCVITGNSATSGGGTYNSILKNCTVVGNTATSEGGGLYSMVSSLVIANSIVMNNNAIAPGTANYYAESSFLGGSINFQYSCVAPLPTNGVGNISDTPSFADGNFHLAANSSCINSGRNAHVQGGSDLDGNPRVVGYTVDIGAFEYPSPGSLLSYAWAYRNGFSPNGASDFSDADHDGASNWQEWCADTDPWDTHSALRMVTTSNGISGVDVTWQSVATRSYSVERSTNFNDASSFRVVANGIAGVAGLKNHRDTSATNAGLYYYRVRVQ